MKVLLAGYNVDTDVIKELTKGKSKTTVLTPETISAAYARISRSPKSVDELRKDSRKEVEKARKSNKSIIFSMGHHSIAEHAVFNFDIMGVSRLAIEEIEKFRLCAYTEKSQRYITLTDDYVVPAEIKGTGFEKLFADTIKSQNDLYIKLYEKLKENIFKKHKDLAGDIKNHALLDGWAKEDARYITSLATEGQLGQTINARNLELLFRRFASHELSEVRELGNRIFSLVEKVAPSIILFTTANDFDQKTYPALQKATSELAGFYKRSKYSNKASREDVTLVNYSFDADNITVAAIMHSASRLSFDDCMRVARKMNMDEKREIIKTSTRYMEFYDSAIREYEYVHLTYELVISASCFAQLKRHRMASIICQKYDPVLGVTIPESIHEIGMINEFGDVVAKTEEAYHKIKTRIPQASDYVLTNAHRRRVLLKVNARELYHISRLREDESAQWDIRQRSRTMVKLAKKVMPLTCLLIGAKHLYPEIYKNIFGAPPKASTSISSP
ncbi:MAG: FAD-dependent thymidylate synthase [bacterium]